MAETLGSLIDKLSIVGLKRAHAAPDSLASADLARQAGLLAAEIDAFVQSAVNGDLPPNRLAFSAHKMTGDFIVETAPPDGLGARIEALCAVNAALWGVQAKVYAPETLTEAEKDALLRDLAALNLKRHHLVEAVDAALIAALSPQTQTP